MHDIGPSLNSAEKRQLKAGMILTVEPGLYFGVRIEDDVLVTKNGCRPLTKSRMEIRVV